MDKHPQITKALSNILECFNKQLAPDKYECVICKQAGDINNIVHLSCGLVHPKCYRDKGKQTKVINQFKNK